MVTEMGVQVSGMPQQFYILYWSMSEWPKESVSKTDRGKPNNVGSNPTAPAKKSYLTDRLTVGKVFRYASYG